MAAVFLEGVCLHFGSVAFGLGWEDSKSTAQDGNMHCICEFAIFEVLH